MGKDMHINTIKLVLSNCSYIT